ncbi:RNA-dependent RNA polymerase [Entamoeba marina]
MSDQSLKHHHSSFKKSLDYVASTFAFGSFTSPIHYFMEKKYDDCYVVVDHSIIQIHAIDYVYRIGTFSIYRIIKSTLNPNHLVIIFNQAPKIYVPSCFYERTQQLDFSHTKFINRSRALFFEIPEGVDQIVEHLSYFISNKYREQELIIQISLKLDTTTKLEPTNLLQNPNNMETAALFQLEGLFYDGIITINQITKQIISKLALLSMNQLANFKNFVFTESYNNLYRRVFDLQPQIDKASAERDYENDPSNGQHVLKMEINTNNIRLGFGYGETNAILEDFGPNYRLKLLRVKFLEGERKLRVLDRISHDLLAETLLHGHRPLFQNKYFEFFLSNPSQSRSGACWFIDNYDQKTRGIAYKSLGIDPKNPKIKNSGILLMRAGLFGSDSVTTTPINPKQIIIIDDVIGDNGTVFSDGVGKISRRLANQVFYEFKNRSYSQVRINQPAAFQIRYAGVKGVVSVDCTDETENIYFRPSQIKIDALPKITQPLRVVQVPEFHHGRMNEQLALGLEYLQIPTENFLVVADNYLKRMCISSSRNSEILDEPFVHSTLLLLKIAILQQKGSFMKFDIPESASLMGVMDESGLLNEGEVFIQTTSFSDNIPSDKLLIVKFPATHPGDFVIFNNVRDRILKQQHEGYERLKYFKDVVVFSSKGKRSDPSKLAGGDLDGDEYLIIWNKRFLPADHIKCHPPACYDSEKVHLEKFLEFDDMKRAFINQLHSKYVLSQISTHHKQSCINTGLCSEVTKSLSNLISIAVDSPKTGAEIDNSEILEFIELVNKQKTNNVSILDSLSAFFKEHVPKYLDILYSQLYQIIDNIQCDSQFISNSTSPKMLSIARGLRNNFNEEIKRYIFNIIPRRVSKDTNILQMIVGCVFRTNSSDRTEWEKEEKEIRRTMTSLVKRHYHIAVQQSQLLQITFKNFVDACYKVTYDKKYYYENEKINIGNRSVICLLYPWAIRPKNNILFLNESTTRRLKSDDIRNLRFGKF